MTNPGVKTLAAEARTTLLEMANHCSIDMETWDRHSNAVLRLADALSQPHSGCPEGWRPIEEHDGSGDPVLLWTSADVIQFVGRWQPPLSSRTPGRWASCPGGYTIQATYYAPLLSAPEPPTP